MLAHLVHVQIHVSWRICKCIRQLPSNFIYYNFVLLHSSVLVWSTLSCTNLLSLPVFCIRENLIVIDKAYVGWIWIYFGTVTWLRSVTWLTTAKPRETERWMNGSKNGSGSNCCIIVYMYEIHWKFQTINCVNLILKYFMRGGINFMCLSEVYVGVV